MELERGAVGKARKEQTEKTRLHNLAKVSHFYKEAKYSRESKDRALEGVTKRSRGKVNLKQGEELLLVRWKERSRGDRKGLGELTTFVLKSRRQSYRLQIRWAGRLKRGKDCDMGHNYSFSRLSAEDFKSELKIGENICE